MTYKVNETAATWRVWLI